MGRIFEFSSTIYAPMSVALREYLLWTIVNVRLE